MFPGQLQLGGVGRNTINLAEELLNKGVRVDLFLSRKAGAYLPLVPETVRIVEGAGSVKSSISALARYLRHERPHLIIAARSYINLATLLAARLARTRTKVVVTERTTVVSGDRLQGGIQRRLIRVGCRFFYPGADHVVAVSEAVAIDLMRITRLRREQIKVIYNPVVTSRIERLAREGTQDPWLASSTVPLILGVGRLRAQKDFPTLIRAFAALRQNADVRLAILGEGEERHALESLVQRLDLERHVYMPGYVENPFAWMSRASVFVLSSAWEGLPTALIEAMATGTPVVSTDCPGGSREILADGRFGVLVPVGDVTSLTEAIRDTLAGLPSSDIVRERAQEFSAGVAADRYLALLDGW